MNVNDKLSSKGYFQSIIDAMKADGFEFLSWVTFNSEKQTYHVDLFNYVRVSFLFFYVPSRTILWKDTYNTLKAQTERLFVERDDVVPVTIAGHFTLSPYRHAGGSHFETYQIEFEEKHIFRGQGQPERLNAVDTTEVFL